MQQKVSWMISQASHWQSLKMWYSLMIVCWPLQSHGLVFPLRYIRFWLSCHLKVQFSGVVLWRCCTAVVDWEGPHTPFHTLVNVVWFYCHFLWWKVIKPFASPSPFNYLSSFQHPWPSECECRGADRLPFIPAKMSSLRSFTSHRAINFPAASWDCVHSPEASNCLPSTLSFAYFFTEALPCFLVIRNFLIFLRQGLRFFKQQGWSLYPAILRFISRK